jgi:hypothetical protein
MGKHSPYNTQPPSSLNLSLHVDNKQHNFEPDTAKHLSSWDVEISSMT